MLSSQLINSLSLLPQIHRKQLSERHHPGKPSQPHWVDFAVRAGCHPRPSAVALSLLTSFTQCCRQQSAQRYHPDEPGQSDRIDATVRARSRAAVLLLAPESLFAQCIREQPTQRDDSFQPGQSDGAADSVRAWPSPRSLISAESPSSTVSSNPTSSTAQSLRASAASLGWLSCACSFLCRLRPSARLCHRALSISSNALLRWLSDNLLTSNLPSSLVSLVNLNSL